MRKPFVIALLAVVASGCGGSSLPAGREGAMAPSFFLPRGTSYGALQFAVGTANVYGGSVGLNIVSTFRQSNGYSAVGVSTPKVSGPFRIDARAVPSFAEANSSSGFPDPYTTVFNGGPSAREWRGSSIDGTPQTVAPGTPSCDGIGTFPKPPKGQNFVRCPNGLSPNTTTFGESGGVFAMGFQPANAVAETGQGYSYQPYPQPMYSAHDPISRYVFVPWGGPPAFDPDLDHMGTRDGLILAGVDSFGDPYFLGVGEGVTVFDRTTPRSGDYTLAVAISTVGSGGVTTTTVRKTATLNASHVLPKMTAPVFVPDGNGGGHVTAFLPFGVKEAYVQIVDYGPRGGPHDGANSGASNCQGARGTQFAPVYYTLLVTSHAKATYRLPDTDGPNLATSGGAGNLKPSPSICTAAQNTTALGSKTNADDIVVQTIGFDYPAYEAAHGLIERTTPQKPTITNAAGQADITLSQAMEQDDGSTTQTGMYVRDPRPRH
ncbi:MAG TPA: hypothetical protein VGG89_00960 [Candidatus Baltobacteraceae bacterium]|jgi:hypothetical protein